MKKCLNGNWDESEESKKHAVSVQHRLCLPHDHLRLGIKTQLHLTTDLPIFPDAKGQKISGTPDYSGMPHQLLLTGASPCRPPDPCGTCRRVSSSAWICRSGRGRSYGSFSIDQHIALLGQYPVPIAAALRLDVPALSVPLDNCIRFPWVVIDSLSTKLMVIIKSLNILWFQAECLSYKIGL